MGGGIGVGGFFWDHVIFSGDGSLTEYKAGGRGGGATENCRLIYQNTTGRYGR